MLGTQLSLFDVSNLRRPVLLRTHALGSSWSEAESDHHAFLWWGPLAAGGAAGAGIRREAVRRRGRLPRRPRRDRRGRPRHPRRRGKPRVAGAVSRGPRSAARSSSATRSTRSRTTGVKATDLASFADAGWAAFPPDLVTLLALEQLRSTQEGASATAMEWADSSDAPTCGRGPSRRALRRGCSSTRDDAGRRFALKDRLWIGDRDDHAAGVDALVRSSILARGRSVEEEARDSARRPTRPLVSHISAQARWRAVKNYRTIRARSSIWALAGSITPRSMFLGRA